MTSFIETAEIIGIGIIKGILFLSANLIIMFLGYVTGEEIHHKTILGILTIIILLWLDMSIILCDEFV